MYGMRKQALVMVLLFGLFIGGPGSLKTSQAEEKPAFDGSVSLYSQYIWRGFEFSRDSVVIQPSLTVSYKGISLNIWQNIDTDPWSTSGNGSTDNLNETDITLAYGWQFGAWSAELGYIWYSLDQAYDSHEIYLSASYDTFLTPTLTIYREFAHYPGTYITLGVSHAIPVMGDMSLELGAEISYLDSDDKGAYADPGDPDDEYSALHTALLSAALAVPINKYLSVSPELYVSLPLSDDAADIISDTGMHQGREVNVFGGITLSLSF